MKVLMDVLTQRLEENGGVWCSGPELTIGDLFVNFMVVGQIKAGDVIANVEGVDTSMLSHAEVTAMLKASSDQPVRKISVRSL